SYIAWKDRFKGQHCVVVFLNAQYALGTSIICIALCFPGVWCFTELFFAREPQDVIAVRKDPVVLDCQANGELPITIVWMKNGVRLVDSERIYKLSNGSLYITEVEHRRGERSDEGHYECLAENSYGAILSQKSHLSVASKYNFEFYVKNVPSCSNKSNVQPSQLMPWLCGNVPFSFRITVLPTGVLQIYGVKEADAGHYRCVATNIANRRRSVEAGLTVIPGIQLEWVSAFFIHLRILSIFCCGTKGEWLNSMGMK
uniref:Protogenin n=1 Tax=Callorhinchus milii TaxID=7868 RepID=A0A4W3GF77_CALMI